MIGCIEQTKVPSLSTADCRGADEERQGERRGHVGSGMPGDVVCLSVASAGRLSERRKGMVLSLIDQAFGRALSGDELAASVGLSKGAFHRAFKATFGMTPFRYLTGHRVKAAARLMVSTDLNLGTIAVEAGFYDQPHLCRQFRKAFGESPDRWRRRQRGPDQRRAIA